LQRVPHATIPRFIMQHNRTFDRASPGAQRSIILCSKRWPKWCSSAALRWCRHGGFVLLGGSCRRPLLFSAWQISTDRVRASVPPADRVCRRHSLPNSLGMLLCERMPRLQCCFRPLPRIYSPNYWTKMLRVPSAGNIQISILSSDSY
jgi:hypothetical protein